MTIFYEPRWSRVQFLVFNRMKSFSHQSSGTGNIVYVMSHIQWWRNQVKAAYQIFSDYFLWCVDLRWEWSAQSPHDREVLGSIPRKRLLAKKVLFSKASKTLTITFEKIVGGRRSRCRRRRRRRHFFTFSVRSRTSKSTSVTTKTTTSASKTTGAILAAIKFKKIIKLRHWFSLSF